jgi:hypothetical protein
MGTLLTHNIIGKSDQLVINVSKLFNDVEQNYSTTKKKTLVMVFTLHKFRHYLLENKFVFYVSQKVLVYLIKKPQNLGKIARWLLLFFEYDFIVIYKPGKIRVNAYALSKLLDTIELTRFPKQTISASLFFIEP